MQIAVLCGGKATRLYPITKTIPKSMVKVAGKPFLEHQINLFKKNKIFDIVLCTGFLSEQIEKYFGDGNKFGVKIEYSREKEELGTGGALKNATNLLKEEFFIIYGDSYLEIDYQKAYSHFKNSKKLGLMTIYKTYGKIEPANVAVQRNLIHKFDKKNPGGPGMIYTEFGLNIFKKEVLDLIDKKSFPIGEYFKKLIASEQLLAYESPVRFYEVGRPETLKETSQYISGHKHK